MDRKEFEAVLEEAAKQRDCEVVDLKFDDDDTCSRLLSTNTRVL